MCLAVQGSIPVEEWQTLKFSDFRSQNSDGGSFSVEEVTRLQEDLSSRSDYAPY
jgi:hypothetical protein